MLHREYQDFNEAYLELNREILQNPQLVEYMNTTMGSIDNINLEIKSSRCDKIDLGALGYKKEKWSHLIKTYLGPDKIEDLKHLGENIKGLSCGFDFLRKTTHNGACMVSIIISRTKRGKPWDTMTILWRTTELQRRWAADLILIHRIAELIPNSQFSKFQFFMASAYQSAMYIIPLVTPVFGLKIENLDPDNPYTKVIITREKKYYIPDKSPHSMLASGQKVVDLYKAYQRGDELPKITYKECTL